MKKKVRLKPEPKDNRRNCTVRLSNQEEVAIYEKAVKYTEGDLSKWIRFAAINHEPAKEELEKVS